MSLWKYDVFISFRGEGTCKGFVDQLYNDLKQNGIRAYRDDSELYSDTGNYHLHEVYEKSMFSIVIFYYPNVSYCLRQLAYFLSTDTKHKFIPIFYIFKPEVAVHLTGSFGEAIARYAPSYGADYYELWQALSMAAIFSGWVFVETTNGCQSFIDVIIKRLSKMIYEESPGKNLVGKNLVESRKGFESTSLERRLSIFWDMKSSSFPKNVNPEDIAKKIKAFVKGETNNNWEGVNVYVYGHSSTEQNTKLHYSGVTLIYTPRGRKDATYIALLVDMFKFCPPPSSIMLITGNIYYTKALHALGLLGHKIILPDDDNFWPWSKLVKREDLVATSSSQFKELSMRCKEFESIDTLDLFILLDLENCPIPREVPTEDLASNILEFLTDKIDCSSFIIRVYGDFSRIPEEVRVSLEKSGVRLIDTPHKDKNAADKNAADEAMIIDLFMYSKLVPSPSSIVVITGDRDLATTLHAIDGFGHDIYLAIPSRPQIDVSKSLTSASKDYWYWSEMAYGIDLTVLKGQLEELLKSNDGQLRLGSLDAEYQKMFNKPLSPSEYKSDNLVNLLNRMSYMISVEVLNGDTLVKLKG